jgi:predicted dehydrogenase
MVNSFLYLGGHIMGHIHWGIIGCGDVTEVKSGPAFQKIEGSDLVAVMRRNGEKAKDYALRHGVPKWYEDADQLIDDPEVNAVYVATPPSSHADYVMRVAEAGKPVYVEKPMALNYKECESMIQACEKAGVPLFVAYYRRCLPTFLKVKELVQSGAIGNVRFVTIKLYLPPEENEKYPENLHWHVLPNTSGGGRFVDLGSHQLDFLDYVFGPIISVKGQAANQAGLYPAEDIVCANFLFESETLGSGVWCFTVTGKDKMDRTEIIGSRGKIVYSSFEPTPVKAETDHNVEEYELPWPEHVQQPLIQTIVDELQGRGKCPSIGITAARTSRVIDEILSEWRALS